MTPFALLISLAGLSHREAEAILDVRQDTIRSWINGRRTAPTGAITALGNLIATQGRAAAEVLALIDEKGPGEIELGFPADDHEAQTLGWPCVGAWKAMAARVIAGCGRPIHLVPRGSTVATAAAAEAHGR